MRATRKNSIVFRDQTPEHFCADPSLQTAEHAGTQKVGTQLWPSNTPRGDRDSVRERHKAAMAAEPLRLESKQSRSQRLNSVLTSTVVQGQVKTGHQLTKGRVRSIDPA